MSKKKKYVLTAAVVIANLLIIFIHPNSRR